MYLLSRRAEAAIKTMTIASNLFNGESYSSGIRNVYINQWNTFRFAANARSNPLVYELFDNDISLILERKNGA